MRVIWTETARTATINLFHHLAYEKHAPLIAARLYQRIRNAGDSLGKHPERHTLRDGVKRRFNIPGTKWFLFMKSRPTTVEFLSWP
jgi:plasmid stabilization system protein ParE